MHRLTPNTIVLEMRSTEQLSIVVVGLIDLFILLGERYSIGAQDIAANQSLLWCFVTRKREAGGAICEQIENVVLKGAVGDELV